MAFPTGWISHEIVIDNTKVPSTLTDYPMLVTLDHLETEVVDGGANSADPAGGDLRFSSDAAGLTPLACELVDFVADATEGSRRCEVWVKIPSVSSASDTSFYVWYNKTGETQPAVTDTYGRNAVWSDYEVVSHDGGPTDSTGNTTPSKTGSPTGTTGKFTSATDYGGHNDAWNYTSIVANSSVFTMQAWNMIDAKSVDSLGQALISFNKSQTERATIAADNSPDQWGAWDNTNSWNRGTSAQETAVWRSAAAVYNGSTDNRFFYEGAREGIDATVSNTTTGKVTFVTGESWPANGEGWDGKICETRLRYSALADDWIEAEYNNQNSPSTFAAPAAAAEFNETFEGAGRNETWDADTITAGASIDDDFSLSVAPNPPTWRTKAFEAVTILAGQEAYASKTFPVNIPDAYVSVSLAIDTEGLGIGANQTLFGGYDSAGDLCFSVRVQRENATDYRYLLSYHHGGGDQFTTTGATLFERNQAFEFRFRWSPVNTFCEIYAEGALLVYQGSLSTTRGALKKIQLGIIGPNQPTRMLCGRVDVSPSEFTLPTQVKEAESSSLIWREDLEETAGDGTTETWTDGINVSGGASVDTNADPSVLAGVPAEWGTKAAKYVVTTTPGAILRTDWGTAYANKLFIKTGFYLETDGLTPTDPHDIDVVVGKKNHTLGENIFALQCLYTNTHGLILRLATGDLFNRGSIVMSVTTGTFYKIEIKIDFVSHVMAVWVNDLLRLEVQTRTSWFDTMQWFMMGQSGSAQGMNTTWWSGYSYVSAAGFPVPATTVQSVYGLQVSHTANVPPVALMPFSSDAHLRRGTKSIISTTRRLAKRDSLIAQHDLSVARRNGSPVYLSAEVNVPVNTPQFSYQTLVSTAQVAQSTGIAVSGQHMLLLLWQGANGISASRTMSIGWTQGTSAAFPLRLATVQQVAAKEAISVSSSEEVAVLSSSCIEWDGAVLIRGIEGMPVSWLKGAIASSSTSVPFLRLTSADTALPFSVAAGAVNRQASAVAWAEQIKRANSLALDWSGVLLVQHTSSFPIAWDGVSGFVEGNVNLFYISPRSAVYRIPPRSITFPLKKH